ncbi:MAG: DNA-deoxyinosine glycosylase [Thiohalocapsa sp.]|jgi:hypoxanthine-DNA glycosylase
MNRPDAPVLPIRRAFPPVLGEAPRLLILGSMPSEASLAAQQYYGHPRNAFWPIMLQLLGLPVEMSYAGRTRALREQRIALWDVIAACARPGSLDADIRPETVQVNDFAGLLAAHPSIRCIAFNGGTAEREFRRRVLPTLDEPHAGIERLRLPSTSPAHAGMRFEAKLTAWRVILEKMAEEA